MALCFCFPTFSHSKLLPQDETLQAAMVQIVVGVSRYLRRLVVEQIQETPWAPWAPWEQSTAWEVWTLPPWPCKSSMRYSETIADWWWLCELQQLRISVRWSASAFNICWPFGSIWIPCLKMSKSHHVSDVSPNFKVRAQLVAWWKCPSGSWAHQSWS